MKLKRIMMISSSALLIGATMPALEHVAVPKLVTSVSAQEDQAALLTRMKKNLLEQEPITEKQLKEVKDEDLLAYYEAASEDLTWQDVFHDIVKNYPQLGLITDKTEYEQFKKALADVQANSDLTADALKNVDPKALIAAYNEAVQANPEDLHTAVQSFIDKLDLNYGKVAESDTSAESDTTSESETTAEGESSWSAYRKALLEKTDLTQEQLSTISDADLENIFKYTGLKPDDIKEESLKVIRDLLITFYPERFKVEQIQTVANRLREKAANSTPLTAAIGEQIPDEDFLQWEREAISSGGNNQYATYEKAFANYPKLFETDLAAAKNKLLENTNLTSEQLAALDGARLLLIVWQVEHQMIDYEQAAKTLNDALGNEQGATTESETTQTSVTEAMTDTTSEMSQASTETSQAATTVVPTTVTESTSNTQAATTTTAATTSAVQKMTTAASTTQAVTTKQKVAVVTSSGIETSTAKKGALPSTGEGRSLSAIILGVMAAIGGFVFLKKKDSRFDDDTSNE
ncbi:LPXTG cell wall anchor domain-containing protein [Tuanshanicoccus lijuaniae]|uniref:LPXTG cell wall anchor domain-containing protein n=1 Tax=Aerococcaceae bacterium zg-1292 TaxID=2774330 RepID=UPI001937FE18|nr:LPXTG cell wall anchor domain-containing protein [Aerococcaceae bacterium zg-1292]QQA36965.1 LPXTG cell wall anchor domain-containing protein [Aerococcaceae bacterium zg-1292]